MLFSLQRSKGRGRQAPILNTTFQNKLSAGDEIAIESLQSYIESENWFVVTNGIDDGQHDYDRYIKSTEQGKNLTKLMQYCIDVSSYGQLSRTKAIQWIS